MLAAVTGANLKDKKGDRGNKHRSKVCEGHRKSVHASVTLHTLHGFRGFSKLYGETPLGIICYGCGSGWPPSGGASPCCDHDPQLHFMGKSCHNILSDCSFSPVERGKTTLRLLMFLGSFIAIWKFGSFFHTNFPDEAAWGCIYTIRRFAPRLCGSLNREFHFSAEGCQSARVPGLGSGNGVSAWAVAAGPPSHSLTT